MFGMEFDQLTALSALSTAVAAFVAVVTFVVRVLAKHQE